MTIITNSDSGVVYPFTSATPFGNVSISAGATFYYSTFLNGAVEDLHADVWEFVIYHANGTAALTLTSGSGLTLSGNLITVGLTAALMSGASLTAGGYSYALIDTTTSRTRVSGPLVLVS